MTSEDFITSCKIGVSEYSNKHNETQVTPDDVYLVWYNKSLQNHKAY